MGHSLREIAEKLRDANKKVQLIYAFNGSGKTRLSREFKELIAPKNGDEEEPEDLRSKVLYYNAFTEDLFYWDNDLNGDIERKLKIQSNAYTPWVLQEHGKGPNAISHFQHYTNEKLTPQFSADFSEITFSYERGNEEPSEHIKISKGEESCFIGSIFHSLIEQVVDVLNVPDPIDRESNQFDLLKYIFIDDPVSSLDENHLIELAVSVARLIKSSAFENGIGLKFIITTHNPLFYNVLFNEFRNEDKALGWKPSHYQKQRLEKHEDGTFSLEEQTSDSPFSYHIQLKNELKRAVNAGEVRKYHFNFLRNILEKTSTFVGYKRWEDLLPNNNDGRPNPYLSRIMNLSSHSKHSGEEIAELREEDKLVLGFLVNKLDEMYNLQMKSE